MLKACRGDSGARVGGRGEALTRVGLTWRRLAQENPGGYARTTLVHLNLARANRRRREVVTEVVPELAARGFTCATGLGFLPEVSLVERYDPNGVEVGLDNAAQVSQVIGWQLDPVIREMRRATRGIVGTAGLAYDQMGWR